MSDFDAWEDEFTPLSELMRPDAPAWFKGCPDCKRPANRWEPCDTHRCRAVKSNGKRCRNAASALSRAYCDSHRCRHEYRASGLPYRDGLLAGCHHRAVRLRWDADGRIHADYCEHHHSAAEAAEAVYLHEVAQRKLAREQAQDEKRRRSEM